MRKFFAFVICISMLFLAGCNSNIPSPKKLEKSTAPNLTKEQEESIRKIVLSVLDTAIENKDGNILKERLSGPALTLKEAQLKVLEKNVESAGNVSIPKTARQVVISNGINWPRDTLVITDTTDDLQTERLLLFNQETPRENYKLWGVVRLFSGSSLPAFEVSEAGSAPLLPNDSSLLETPESALAEYASLLQEGDSSSFAGKFDNDIFRDEVKASAETAKQSLDAVKGSQTQTFSPNIQAIRGMKTADGGALIIGEINSVWVRRTGNQSNATPANEAEKIIFGDKKTATAIAAQYINLVALSIPPSGSTQKIKAVGAERYVIDVNSQ